MTEHRSPAETYDELFVPALFEPWGPIVADAADVKAGDRVLDIACGTGTLTRTAAARAGQGLVTGLDPNGEMLEVARRRDPEIDWRAGRAESIPFPDDTFDAVVSQFGFMFFEDQRAALAEMVRVLRPGGHLAVAVCDAIDHSPGYAVFVELLHRLFGAEVAESFRAPFSMGDSARLLGVSREAGIPDAGIRRHDGTVRFASIEAMVSTVRACAWTLGGLLDDGQFERLVAESHESLQPFVTPDGSLAFVMPALVLTATA
jgi:ubiquinone/menaquinone biosynthesis C-methylase UbiE